MLFMQLQHKRPDGEVDTYHLKPGRKYHLGRGSACELRILDLKLSRKHCCVEFVNGAWQIEDLGSTNGCKVNGRQIVGSQGLAPGHRIEAGTTLMTVMRFIDPEQSNVEAVQQEPLPDGDERSITDGAADGDWEPEPSTNNLAKTDALLLGLASAEPPSSLEKSPVTVQSEGDQNITLAPNTLFATASALTPRAADAPAVPVAAKTLPPPPPGLSDRQPPQTVETAATRPAPRIKPVTIRVGRVDGGELHTPTATPPYTVPVVAEPSVRSAAESDDARTFFITVLGRRIGPLARAAARDLKARELKGLLTISDLDAYLKG